MWDPLAAWQHDESRERTLYLCFCLSIALHALALFAFPGLRPGTGPDDSTVLTAMFEPRAASEPSAPAPALRKLRERREIPILRLEQARSPEPSPLPEVASPMLAPVASPQAEAPRASEPVSTDSAAKAPAEISDPGLLEAYRLALIDAAKRYKRYPVQAMERGWEGRVEIRVVVDANGAIKNALVKTSSRYQILDAQALDMVKRAFNALTQVRPAPRGREFTVDVPVVFELQTG